MSANTRFHNDSRLFNLYGRQSYDEYEDDLADEEDTVETQIRSSEENTRRMPQRQQSERLKRGGLVNSSRQMTNQLTPMQRHQSHYFSNVDLFQQDDESFNYLKYARASETRTAPTS